MVKHLLLMKTELQQVTQPRNYSRPPHCATFHSALPPCAKRTRPLACSVPVCHVAVGKRRQTWR